MSRSLVALSVVLALCTCAWLQKLGRPTPPPTDAVLFFTADLHGYLEPCGCSENMRGGLSRSAGVIAAARDGGLPVVLIDSGDGLFPSANIPEAAVGQQERKARAIADGLTAMGLAARAPGELDDVRGAGFHAGLKLPELAPESFQLIDVKGHQLAVVRATTLHQATALGVKAREAGAVFVVALLPMSFEGALKGLVDASSLDLVLASRPKDELAAEQNRVLGGGQLKLVQLQNKGRSLLRVDLTLRDDSRPGWLKGSGEQERELATLDERIELLRGQVNDPGASEALRELKKGKLDDLLQRRAEGANAPIVWPSTGNAAAFRFVAIETTLPKDPKVDALEQAYDRDVGQLNLAWAKEHGKACEPPSAERPGFVGTAVCGSCHPDALTVWQGSRHAHAFEDLEAKGKQYHLDCIGCHVAGWQQPGGVCRVDQTEQRREVGCESCHGAGSTHVALPTKATIRRGAKEVCVGCHDHENSTHFEYESYLAKIRGPGHGAPKEAVLLNER